MRPQKGIAVDSYCINGNPGDCGFRAIDLDTCEILFQYKITGKCTNGIVEFLALVKGVQYLINNNRLEDKIYSYSDTALAWYRNGKHKSKLPLSTETEVALNQLQIAFSHIPTSNKMNYVEFWNNKEWGQITTGYKKKSAHQ